MFVYKLRMDFPNNDIGLDLRNRNSELVSCSPTRLARLTSAASRAVLQYTVRRAFWGLDLGSGLYIHVGS